MNTLMVLLYDKIKMGDFEVIDFSSFTELVFRFALNLGVVLLLARWLYYSVARRKDYLFYLHSYFIGNFPTMLPS